MVTQLIDIQYLIRVTQLHLQQMGMYHSRGALPGHQRVSTSESSRVQFKDRGDVIAIRDSHQCVHNSFLRDTVMSLLYYIMEFDSHNYMTHTLSITPLLLWKRHIAVVLTAYKHKAWEESLADISDQEDVHSLIKLHTDLYQVILFIIITPLKPKKKLTDDRGSSPSSS